MIFQMLGGIDQIHLQPVEQNAGSHSVKSDNRNPFIRDDGIILPVLPCTVFRYAENRDQRIFNILSRYILQHDIYLFIFQGFIIQVIKFKISAILRKHQQISRSAPDQLILPADPQSPWQAFKYVFHITGISVDHRCVRIKQLKPDDHIIHPIKGIDHNIQGCGQRQKADDLKKSASLNAAFYGSGIEPDRRVYRIQKGKGAPLLHKDRIIAIHSRKKRKNFV